MNTGISPGAKWFTLCLPFFQYLFFHCKFTISISVSVCRCKSKVDAKIVQAERKTVQAERKMKFTSIFPRRSRFYPRAKQTCLILLIRGAAYFMRKNIFRDIVRISKINRYFCIID